MAETTTLDGPAMEELDALRRRLMELEEMEVMRVTAEQERFDSLQVLDEYARELEESRDKLARLLRAGTDVQEAKTVQEALQKIADAVGQAGWGSVSVGLFRDWEVMQSAYFGCSKADIEFLETHRRPPEDRARFYGPDFERFKISRSYFVPADNLEEVISVEQVVPGRRTVQPGDTWDPMDLAYVPLYGSQGQVVGSINCDDPLDGRRPSSETFFLLELFADLAARKVETAQLVEQQKRIEEALRRSEAKYRTIFDRSGDAYFIMDTMFRDCNRRACELWRCDTEEIVGHSPAEFSPEIQPNGRRSEEAAQGHISRALNGEPQLFYWQHMRKDGGLLDCEVSLAPIEVDDRKLILAAVRDVTERMRAETERETILRILQVANSEQDREQMVHQIFAEIAKVVPVENYFLALYDDVAETVSFPHFVDASDPTPPTIPLGNGLTAWVIRRGLPLRIGPAEFERMRTTGEIESCGTPALSWLGVPLTIQSRTIGALVVQSYKREGLFELCHERVLQAVAAQIATILDRKRVEEERQTMASLVENSSDCISMLGLDGRIIYGNDTGVHMVGARTLSEAKQHSMFDLIPESDRERVVSAVESTVTDGHWEGELEIRRLDNGQLVPIQVHGFLIQHLDAGQEIALGIVARDLTEHRRAETALRESEERYRRLVEVSPDAIAIHQDGKIAYVNQGTLKLMGAGSADELLGRPVMEVVAPESQELVGQRIRQVMEGVQDSRVLEEKFVRMDGSIIDVEVASTATTYEGRPAVQVVCRDISDRKRAHQELLMFRKAVEASADAIFITDLDGIITFINEEFTHIYGYAAPDVVGRCTPRVLKSGTMKEGDYKHFWDAILSKQVVKGELTNRTRDGRTLAIEGTANPILDDQNRIVGFLAIQRDISERKKSEAILRDSEENLRWLVENLDEPVGILDTEERFIFANPSMCRLMGVPQDELVGANVSRFLDAESFQFVKSQTRLRQSGLRSRYELRIRRGDGEERHIELTATPQFDAHGNLKSVVAAAKDLSGSGTS